MNYKVFFGVIGLHFSAATQSIEVGQVFVINTSAPAPAAANPQ